MTNEERKGLILIVDDDRSILNLISASLNKAGYEVVTAENGRTALQLTSRRSFDLVFLDVAMPGLSGLDILTLMKAGRPDTPVIMLTGITEDVVRDEALVRDAFAYIPKPFNMRDITAMADQLLVNSEKKTESLV